MAGQNEDIDRIREELSLNEKRLLLALRDERSLRPDKAVRKGGFSKEVEVMNAASWLRSKGLVKISDLAREKDLCGLGPSGKKGARISCQT